MFNFQRGDLTGVAWIPQGGNAAAALTVKDQDLDILSLLLDVTTTLAGGFRARIAGLGDAAATINAVYDADNSPYLPIPAIIPGAGGLLVFGITAFLPQRGISVPMRIEKVHWKSGIETSVMYSFDAKMDSRLGLIVYPAL
jgi:hypothetical protein